jgi:hypothetical protein
MVNNIRCFVSALFLLSAAVAVHAGEGTTSADFLNIDPSARSVGMGSAYAAPGDDAFAFYHNPAGLAQVTQIELGLSHVQWVDQMHSEYGVIAVPLDGGFVVSAGGSYFTSGSMAQMDDAGNVLGSYSYTGTMGGASIARRLGDLALGVTAKTVNESMAGYSASAYGVDAGGLYFCGPLTLAAALENLGSSDTMDSQSSPMPRTATGGISWRQKALLLAGEYDRMLVSGTSARTYVGGEYNISPDSDDLWSSLVVRGGWQFGRDTGTGNGMTFGAGFMLGKHYSIDYAMAPMGDLGITHRISLKIDFIPTGNGDERKEKRDLNDASSQPAGKDFTNAVEAAENAYRSGKITLEEMHNRLRAAGFD